MPKQRLGRCYVPERDANAGIERQFDTKGRWDQLSPPGEYLSRLVVNAGMDASAAGTEVDRVPGFPDVLPAR